MNKEIRIQKIQDIIDINNIINISGSVIFNYGITKNHSIYEIYSTLKNLDYCRMFDMEYTKTIEIRNNFYIKYAVVDCEHG